MLHTLQVIRNTGETKVRFVWQRYLLFQVAEISTVVLSVTFHNASEISPKFALHSTRKTSLGKLPRKISRKTQSKHPEYD